MFLNRRIFFGSILTVLLYALPVSQAQISTDGTLGAVKSLPGPDYKINADLGKQIGPNLFHSFGQFNIHSGESATFTGPASVENIISRVTGGSGSWIDGILRSGISGADMYLLNPAGVMFGPNASLDISGSFHVTTADYLRLGDRGRFDATQPEKSLLTSAPPSAFGFIDDTPAGVSLEGGFLKVPEGETLSVTGGDINIKDGHVYASGGQIYMTSIASAGEADFEDTGINADAFEKFGNINITQLSSELPEIEGRIIDNIDASGTKAGNVYIQGERLVADGGWIKANTRGDKDGGCIDIRLSGDLIISDGGGIASNSLGAGGGSKISVGAENIEMSGKGNIQSVAKNSGKGADINITARDSISISENITGIVVKTEGEGDAGKLTVSAKSLTITNDAFIFCFTDNIGRGADISIHAEKLELTDGGFISAPNFDKGNGGDLLVSVTDSVTISGRGQSEKSGIYARVYDSGKGGNISISAPRLLIQNGGVISIDNFGEGDGGKVVIAVDSLDIIGKGGENINDRSYISSSAHLTGRGGDIEISATDHVLIDGSSGNASAIESISINEEAGNIKISSPVLILRNSASVLCSTSEGRAGNIELEVGTLEIRGGLIDSGFTGPIPAYIIEYHAKNNGIEIKPPTKEGKGGNVKITASDSILLEGKTDWGEQNYESGVVNHQQSQISSQTGGTGNAGKVEISTPRLIIGKGGRISVPTKGEGNAGYVVVNADNIEIKDGGNISSSSIGPGTGGDITLSVNGSVLIENDGKILVGVTGSGDAGKLTITAPSLTISGGGKVDGRTTGEGRGADIEIEAERIEMTDGYITAHSEGSGDAGNIHISASDLLVKGGITCFTTDKETAGSINIDAKRLELSEGGIIDSDTRSIHTTAKGGKIIISATDFIRISGGFISSSTTGDADAGTIDIHTPQLLITNGGAIITQSYPSEEIETGGKGNAGNIILNVKTLELVGRGHILASTDSAGKGGDIEIFASEAVRISGDGKLTFISSHSNGSGTGGNIFIHAEKSLVLKHGEISSESASEDKGGAAGKITIESASVRLINSSSVTTEAKNTKSGDADDGKIVITAGNRVSLSDSRINTSVQGGSGKGGDIEISQPESVIMNRSGITANAYEGDGGNIRIVSGQFVRSSGSVTEASSELGIDGKVDISSPETDIGSGLTALPAAYLNADQWLKKRCEERSGEDISKFVIFDRIVPPSPDGCLGTNPPFVSDRPERETEGYDR